MGCGRGWSNCSQPNVVMRFCVTVAVCWLVLSWIITTPWLNMPRRLFWIACRNFSTVSQQTPALTMEPLGKKSTSRKPFLSQNIVHMIFRVEVVCLNFVFVGDEVCFHSMDCWLDSGVSCDTHVSSPVTTAQEVITFLTVSRQKVQSTRLPFQFVFFRKQLRHPVCTQFTKLKFIRHNFVKKWPWNLRKCRESDIMVNRLFSVIFSSTARTKSSFTRRSAAPQIIMHICTPSLNSRTHLCTTELHMACSPHTSKSWWWISAGFMFFALQKRITDYVSHAAGFSIFLNIINTQHDV